MTGLANVRFIVVKEYKPKEGAEGGKLDPERLQVWPTRLFREKSLFLKKFFSAFSPVQNCPHTSTASTKVVKDGC